MRRILSRVLPIVALTAFCTMTKVEAFQSYVVAGTTYSFPDVDDTDWGQNVTDWAGAVSVAITAVARSTISLGAVGNNTNYMLLDGSTQTKTGSIFGLLQISVSSASMVRAQVSSFTVTTVFISTTANLLGPTTFNAPVTVSTICTSPGNCFTLPPVDGTSGQALTTNGSKAWTFTTIASGGGSGVSTFTYTFSCGGGDVFLATSPYVAIPGCVDTVTKSTMNVYEVRAFVIDASTIGLTALSLAKSTSTDVGSPFNYITARSSVAVNTKYSVWTSTQFTMYPNDSFTVHITSAQSGPGFPGGSYGYQFKYWKTEP